jgi:hypothetical protein
MQLLFAALKTNRSIRSLDLGYAPSTRVLGAKANQLSSSSAQLLTEYFIEQAQIENLDLTRTNLPEVNKELLKKEMERRGVNTIVMDGHPSKPVYHIHPDSRAIKSVYR